MNPLLPDIRLELLEDLASPPDSGFLRIRRRRLRATYPDGTTSQPFLYDEVDRVSLDAVVMVAHYLDPSGTRCLYLRSALRPPLVFRDRSRSPIPDQDPRGSIWELPAGLVEAHEQSPEGLRASAARELAEELGFLVKPEALEQLGPSTFPTPGIIAERHFFFEVEVDPQTRTEPQLDGSALERDGVVVGLPLQQVLEMCRDGRIVDGKTELAVRRLAERFA